MANRFFSQYLLNEGIISPEDVGSVLAKSLDAVPGAEIIKMDTPMSEGEARLGQVLLDEGLLDAAGVKKALEAIRAVESQPVNQVVAELLEAREKDQAEYEHVREYIVLFLESIQNFLHTDVAIIRDRENDWQGTSYLTYQSMGGSLQLTVGCRMTSQVLLAMASRFSDEEQSKVDDMAIDCIEEFCNVVNGLYIVSMSGKSHDMDLEMPKTVENSSPYGEYVFQLRVETEFGGFAMYISMDGFILNDGDYLH